VSQCVAVFFSVQAQKQVFDVCVSKSYVAVCCSVLRFVLQCVVAVCCSVLQCVAVC